MTARVVRISTKALCLALFCVLCLVSLAVGNAIQLFGVSLANPSHEALVATLICPFLATAAIVTLNRRRENLAGTVTILVAALAFDAAAIAFANNYL